MKGLQLLTTLNSDLEAQLIKGKLSELGIESFIQYSDSVGFGAIRDSLKGVDIFVEPYDFEKATWLISNAKDDLADDEEIGVVD
jgi:hypothetical protein